VEISERRTRRSEHPAQAVHFYLRSVAERDAHLAVALADSCGHRIAGLGDEILTREMAHAAPHALSNGELLPPDLRCDDDLRVWSVVLGESAYYVAAMGGRMERPDALEATLDRLLTFEPAVVPSA